MKKRAISVLLALLLLSMPLCIPAYAAVSFNNIADTTPMNVPYTFKRILFEAATSGEALESIEFTGLPAGTLKNGTTTVVTSTSSATVPVEEINDLVYTPATDSTGAKVFTFTVTGSGSGTVASKTFTLTVTEIKPKADDLHLTTARNTKVSGTMTGSDTISGRGPLIFKITGATETPAASGIWVLSNNLGTVTETPDFPSFEFTPPANFVGLATFQYTATTTGGGGVVSAPATVSIYVGGRPAAQDQSVTITKDQKYTGTLQATDPLGRTMTFQVVDAPKESRAFSITDSATGKFEYTPKAGFEGEDSFTFRVQVKSYSVNAADSAVDTTMYSNTATVKLTVAKYAITPVAYSDMVDHWAAHSVGSLAALGIVKGETIGFSTTGTPGGALEERTFFRPDDTLTRGEFIMWMVAAMKLKPDTSGVSVFADAVPGWLIGPSNAAFHANIAMGTLVNGRPHLRGGNNLTRLEAMVMVDRAMKMTAVAAQPPFVDWNTVPEWGQQAVRNLHGYKIVVGTPTGYLFPHEHLTRAEAAEILFKAYKQEILDQL